MTALYIVHFQRSNIKESGRTSAQRPAERPNFRKTQKRRRDSQEGMGIMDSYSAVFDSSVTAGSAAGSGVFAGGDVWFGKLVVDSVGELVACDCASGGVALVPECVCASFARRLV
jgi:hypothetical protein